MPRFPRHFVLALALSALLFFSSGTRAHAGGSCSGCSGSGLTHAVNQAMNRILEVLYQQSRRSEPGAPIRLDLGPLNGMIQIRVHDLNKSFHGAVRVVGDSILIHNPKVAGETEEAEFKGDPSTGLVNFVPNSIRLKSDAELIEEFAHEICRTNLNECPPRLENRWLIEKAIANRVKDDPFLHQYVQEVREQADRLRQIEGGSSEAPEPCWPRSGGASRTEIPGGAALRAIRHDLDPVAHQLIQGSSSSQDNLLSSLSSKTSWLNAEATLTTETTGECVTTRDALVASGLAVPGGLGCTEIKNPTLTFFTGRHVVLRGAPIDASSCKVAARALYHAVFNHGLIDSLIAYCEDVSGLPGRQQLVLDSLHNQEGMDSLLYTQDLTTCNITRNALIDSGLGVELYPGSCSIQDTRDEGGPPLGSGRIEFDIKDAYRDRLLAGRTWIPARSCEAARKALSATLTVNDGELSPIGIIVACEPGPQPDLARMRVRILGRMPR